MKSVNIFTNGKTLFTLENYDKVSGVCHVNGITLKGQVSKLKARAMHSNGSLHYIFGMGNRNVLSTLSLKRNQTFGKFQVK
jgi:hypothetical protein